MKKKILVATFGKSSSGMVKNLIKKLNEETVNEVGKCDDNEDYDPLQDSDPVYYKNGQNHYNK